jgi:undecaprenyl-phosphate galactose phosphotransferase
MWIVALLDFIFLIILFYATTYVRVKLNGEFDLPKLIPIDLSHFFFIIVIIFILLWYEKIYKYRYDFWQDAYKVVKSFFIGFLIVSSILVLTKSNLNYSRVFIFLYFILGIIFMPVYKRFVKRVLSKFAFFKDRVLVIGEDKERLDKFKEEIKTNWYLCQEVVNSNFKNVIIISNKIPKESLNTLIEKHMNNNRNIYIVPYIDDINFAHSNIQEYSNIRQNTIEIENRLLNSSSIVIKSIFDYILAILILPILIILHLIIAILIKLDSKGAVFFKQDRVGKNGDIFKVYKYRTMVENSDNLLKEYLAKNPDEVEYFKKFHKYKNDPRVTKIGKFLRETSLDELPQVINILKREMSFVGPRPYIVEEMNILKDNANLILKVKPGLTGLWQVNGRNNLTFKERVKLERWYIKNWNLWLDFVILVKTAKTVIRRVGAK